jgi:hypothetical protein
MQTQTVLLCLALLPVIVALAGWGIFLPALEPPVPKG